MSDDIIIDYMKTSLLGGEDNLPECIASCNLKEKFLNLTKKEEDEIITEEISLVKRDMQIIYHQWKILRNSLVSDIKSLEDKYQIREKEFEGYILWGENRLKELYNGY